MDTFVILTKRNIKLFFRDRGMFLTAMMTPMILLLLYAAFLGKSYRDMISGIMEQGGWSLSEPLIDGFAAGQLLASLLSVCGVTVSFCSNLLMVQDKAAGTRRDLDVTPVRSSTLAMAYYTAALSASAVICLTAAGACLLYIASKGWYLTLYDVGMIAADVFLLVMFGTALSGIISFFLSTQGQISAVGAVVSAAYGFLCGAYLPVSQSGETLREIISCLPGTYGTCLLRNHALRGIFETLENSGVPGELTGVLRDTADCSMYCDGIAVSQEKMYFILVSSILFLLLIYLLLHRLSDRRRIL